MSRMMYLIKLITFSYIAFALSFSALVFASPTENTAQLEKGQQYFNAGNYKQALAIWQQLADRGEPEAQVFVGLAYANGWGVKKNLEAATDWYMKAAENNSASGQFLLGLHYVTNSVNQYDVRVGIKWLKRAADNGEKSAIRFLKKAKRRNWFKDLKNDAKIDRYQLEKEGRSLLDAYSISANTLPKLPAPTM